MAFLMPLLLLLLLGMVEFGWKLGQFNDVRHGAREAARLAAVDAGTVATMGSRVCSAMDMATGVTITFTDSANGQIGEPATVTVVADVASLSGLSWMEAFLPDMLTSSVDIRLEQPSDSWSTGSHTC
jgi:Flp pilus assembly protein TadG